jgi:hypothetical protein
MVEGFTPIQRAQLIRRQHMRIRTIAVSFAAAVTSARHDMDVGPAERDALIETWRAWSLGVLEGYAGDLSEVPAAGDPATDEDLAGVRSALAAAIERVRSA